MSSSHILDLPRIKTYAPASITEFYGAPAIASTYCEFKNPPRILYRHWQHGWVQKSRQLEPNLVAAEFISNKKALILVARKDEEEYLIREGYHAKAIGLPFCYVSSRQYSKIKNSLLVMPCHTSRFVPIEFNEKYKLFINYVLEQKSIFDFVCICMHQDDIDLGYAKIWEDFGFQVIRGAAINDENALVRIHALMSQFETILSDVMGSHLVYAASSGAKISLVQPIGREYQNSNDPFFQGERAVLRKPLADIAAIEMNPKSSPYSFLFDEPKKARQHIDWGLEQIGFRNRVSPCELRHFLGWNLPEKLLNEFNYYAKKSIYKAKSVVKSWIKVEN